MMNMTRKEINDRLFTLVRNTLCQEQLDSIPIRKILSRFGSSSSQLEVIQEIINESLAMGINQNDLKKLKALITKISDVQFYMQVR